MKVKFSYGFFGSPLTSNNSDDANSNNPGRITNLELEEGEILEPKTESAVSFQLTL